MLLLYANVNICIQTHAKAYGLWDRYDGVAKKKRQNASSNVSFRLTPEIFAMLATYAQNAVDESGRPLTAGQGARRIIIESLKALARQKSSDGTHGM